MQAPAGGMSALSSSRCAPAAPDAGGEVVDRKDVMRTTRTSPLVLGAGLVAGEFPERAAALQ